MPTIEDLLARLRPGQRALGDWSGGPLAVSAVPGSGKSTGMAIGAAIAIARHQLHQHRQLVVVTFTRSAAANIKAKIRDCLQELRLPPGGFQVSTLHGLAWSIARRHIDYANLPPDGTLITPNRSHRLLRQAVEQWIGSHSDHYQQLLLGRQFDGEETERLRRQSVLRTEILPELAHTVIHEAKSSGLSAADLQQQGAVTTDTYGVLAIAAGLYDFYNGQLRFQDLIDYDDMMLAALRVLEQPALRQHWQERFFAVFEDEAQDSSPLQTQLLEILAADPAAPDDWERQNLVRVGDPNQAINATFTPADPRYFRAFCDRCQSHQRLATMTQAGRSTRAIIDAANFMLAWVNEQWPRFYPAFASEADRPFRTQAIQRVGPDDPQPQANPPPLGTGLELHTPPDVRDTAAAIGQRAIALFAQHPDLNAAVLTRTNDQGRWLAQELTQLYGTQLAVYEVGQRDRQSQVPAELLTLLQFIQRPHSPDHLKAALTTLTARHRIPKQDLNALAPHPEQFLYPGPLDPPLSEAAQPARQLCTSLLKARQTLPSHQLIPFIALSLEYDATELATADKLGDRLRQQLTADNSLGAMLAALSEIVAAEQFEPVETDQPENRYTRPGQLTLITMHKAKGLDWDVVFLPFLHENVLPGSTWVSPQQQFLGDFTLAAIARAQIRQHLHGDPPAPDELAIWQQAQALKTAEEYRLLYVAMTRAKRLLWLSAAQAAPFTWNKPDNLEARSPCPVFPALQQQFPAAVR